jgi:hypothetical protein
MEKSSDEIQKELFTCAAKRTTTVRAKLAVKNKRYRQIVHVTILPYFHAHKIKTETAHILPRSYT